MKRLCVLGSNSGRNAGDAAILSSIITNISKLKPETIFEVPVPRKRNLYDRFKRNNVRAVPMMPWNLSLRFLGLPTLLSMMRSDVVIITDGIIFDVRLFNPLFNFLIQLVILVPLAKLMGKKIVCFLVGIGPLDTYWGRRLARLVCGKCDDIYVRESHSAGLLKEIGVDPTKISIYADAAFIDEPASEKRVNEIMKENGLDDSRPIVGININAYLNQWLKGNSGLDPDIFVEQLFKGIDAVIGRMDCRVAFVITQHMDIGFASGVLEKAKHRDRIVLLSNECYSAEELMGVMGRMKVFIGMRLHSLILASAMGTPCIGLAYAPKVRHFMELMEIEDLKIELSDLTHELFAEAVVKLAGREVEVRKRITRRSGELKKLAQAGFSEFARKYL